MIFPPLVHKSCSPSQVIQKKRHVFLYYSTFVDTFSKGGSVIFFWLATAYRLEFGPFGCKYCMNCPLHFSDGQCFLMHFGASACIFQPPQRNSCPVPVNHKYTSVLCLLPSVYIRQWTVLCPAKAALFCLCSLFYPRANRRGRVPDSDPIFHAQPSFVWHTALDKNPNSRASLILKSNRGAERAFNHPLSVLQWLPLNLPGSVLFIAIPRVQAVPRKISVP